MTPIERHDAAQAHTEASVTALMKWVASAQQSLTSDKMDGTARARIGELIINACRYLAEREAAAKKLQDKAAYDALPSTTAFRQKLNSLRRSDLGS